MRLEVLASYLRLNVISYLVFYDIDGVLKRLVPHWTKIVERDVGLRLNTAEIVTIDDLFDLLPSELHEWFRSSFRIPENYIGIPPEEGVEDSLRVMRKGGANTAGCLTARREDLRAVTEPDAFLQLGKGTPVLMRPLEMDAFEDARAFKADVLTRLFPRIAGIVEDDAKIIPVLRTRNYRGTVYLFKSSPPRIPGIRVVPCRNHAEVAQALTEDAKKFCAHGGGFIRR